MDGDTEGLTRAPPTSRSQSVCPSAARAITYDAAPTDSDLKRARGRRCFGANYQAYNQERPGNRTNNRRLPENTGVNTDGRTGREFLGRMWAPRNVGDDSWGISWH